MLQQQSEHRHPFTSLLLLLAIILVCVTVSMLLANFIGSFIFGPDFLSAVGSGHASTDMQRFFVSFSSVGMFVLPPILFAAIQRKDERNYLGFRSPKPWILFVIALAVMMFCKPFLEWTIWLNQQMKLPGFLSSVEDWMRYKEIQAELLTKKLLVMKTPEQLYVNLLVIAIIPAVGEELLFRGCLQRIFSDWANSFHWGIWISAILFSAIHVQFYGFLPRMILGALFGYLFFLGKSIWIPILAHFFNNASAVVMAYFFQQQGKSLNNIMKPESYSWYLVIVSVIFTTLLFWLFIAIARKDNDIAGNERRLE